MSEGGGRARVQDRRPRDTLRPAPPESVTLAASTATTATISWSHSTETRLPRTGYRVAVSTQPGASWTTTGTSLQVTGLPTGAEHRLTVRAVNANGESADQRGYDGTDPTTVTYARPVRDLTVTTSRVDGSTTGDLGGGTPGADYCAEASWLPSIADPGTRIENYSVALGTYAVDVDATTGADGRIRLTRCGLAPAQLQTFLIRPIVAAVEGAPATASATTPDGPAPGTR